MLNKIPDKPSEVCRICHSSSVFHGEVTILKKHRASYFRCIECGFIQTEEPYWLEEAYSAAIAGQDVGIMGRNLHNSEVVSAILELLFSDTKDAIDFGAGHGILVRMMRDRGFNFFWFDRYAANDYARGFEAQQGRKFDFLTAFEVLEHFTDPISEISKLMELSGNVLVSTVLVPTPVPKVDEWWYFMPRSGQHISFYTEESLRLLARRFKRHLLSFNSYHLFSTEPKNRILFELASRPRCAKLLNHFFRRPSLVTSDLTTMIQ
ncbi:MAG: class I SAM-dependent methyltransferase [Terracidiphilus sp.]